MEANAISALRDILGATVSLSKPRRETLSLLILGMLSARTTNLSHLACERTGPTLTASSYRRLQRFFQHTRLEPDWAAPLIARLAGLEGPRTLILDRTNWKTGESEINLLVLAAVTARQRVPLMWTVLDRPGNSGAPERIALMERYLAKFGEDSVKLLLADREFIGADWLSYLIEKDIPFAIRLREGQRAITDAGRSGSLRQLLVGPGGRRRAIVTLANMAGEGGAPGPEIAVRALRPKGREAVIVATNRPGLNALQAYRRRWAIECLFAHAKTRGLNLEDTRLTCPRKLALLTAIIALAMAWVGRAAADLLGPRAPARKSHGYFAKSRFRIGFDQIRRLLRTNPIRALHAWRALACRTGPKRVV